MITLTFNCTFLSDVILNASSATAGTKASLEYIPGAKFLGITAKGIYDELSQEVAHRIFHKGSVSFGDAHLVYDNERSLKIPFDFWEKKKKDQKEEDIFWVDHLLEDSERKKMLEEGNIQRKQRRNGYFLPNKKKVVSIKTDYSLKTAYDTDLRRSKDGEMYGYKALKKGSVWQFKVELKEDLQPYADMITKALIGEHGLGKSRSAQYGRVSIEKIELDIEKNTLPPISNRVVVYAASNLCFINEGTGQYTINPQAKQLGFGEDAKVDWSFSKIEHRVYAPWNVMRSSRDNDRWIIEKGSVFIIDKVTKVDWEKIQNGIGLFKAEGYGKVLINPAFLLEKKITLDKNEPVSAVAEKAKRTAVLSSKDVLVQRMLVNIRNRRFPQNNIAVSVTDFMREQYQTFEPISNSQWGQIRNIAQNVTNNEALDILLFHKTAGFLYTAKRKREWSSKTTILKDWTDKYVNFKDRQTFLIALASEMAKKTTSNGN